MQQAIAYFLRVGLWFILIGYLAYTNFSLLDGLWHSPLWRQLSGLGASSGQQYLWRYGLLLLASMVIMIRLVRHKPGRLSRRPRLALKDPYDLAYLRAGPKGVLQQAFLGLVAKKVLVQTGRVFTMDRQANPALMSPEEHALYRWYWHRHQGVVQFPSTWPRPAQVLGELLQKRQQSLRCQGLIPGRWHPYAVMLLAILIWMASYMIGKTHYMQYKSIGKPVTLLYIMLFYWSIWGICFLFMFSWSESFKPAYCTKDGALMLRSAKNSLASQISSGNSWDREAMLVAVLGLSALALTSLANVAMALNHPGRSGNGGDYDFGDSGDGGCSSGCGGCGGGD